MSYEDVVQRIAGRATLVAVTKGRSLDETRALYDAGQRDFGENRADEMAAKATALPSDARWHYIGNLQRNKLKLLDRAHLVHSFDRPELAPAWPRRVPVLMQVDFTGRAYRNGIPPDDLAAALADVQAHGIDVRGLATLPSQGADPLPVFRKLREMRDALGLRELSMGMTADFDVAIDEGATMVRVGRGLFE